MAVKGPLIHCANKFVLPETGWGCLDYDGVELVIACV